MKGRQNRKEGTKEESKPLIRVGEEGGLPTYSSVDIGEKNGGNSKLLAAAAGNEGHEQNEEDEENGGNEENEVEESLKYQIKFSIPKHSALLLCGGGCCLDFWFYFLLHLLSFQSQYFTYH